MGRRTDAIGRVGQVRFCGVAFLAFLVLSMGQTGRYMLICYIMMGVGMACLIATFGRRGKSCWRRRAIGR